VRLPGDHRDAFDAAKGESGLGEYLPKAEEPSEGDWRKVFKCVVERLFAPVPAASVHVVDPADVGDETKQDEREEHENLDAGKNELHLAVAALSATSLCRKVAPYNLIPTKLMPMLTSRKTAMYTGTWLVTGSQ
jgi:hypothetical protein